MSKHRNHVQAYRVDDFHEEGTPVIGKPLSWWKYMRAIYRAWRTGEPQPIVYFHFDDGKSRILPLTSHVLYSDGSVFLHEIPPVPGTKRELVPVIEFRDTRAFLGQREKTMDDLDDSPLENEIVK